MFPGCCGHTALKHSGMQQLSLADIYDRYVLTLASSDHLLRLGGDTGPPG